MTGEIMCQTCGEYGHNKRTCPVLKERSDKVAEAMVASGHTDLRDFMADKESPCNMAWDVEGRISWRELEAYKYHREMKSRNKERRGRVRKCSFCEGTGHNRRTCKVKTETNKKQAKVQSYIHRFVACILRATKCVPGSLVTTTIEGWDKDWKTLDPLVVYGLVTSINWDTVGHYNSDVDHLPHEELIRTMLREPILNIKWTLPAEVSGHRRPPPRSSYPLAGNSLGNLGPQQNHYSGTPEYKFMVGPSEADKWVEYNKDYRGADLEGCPAEWNIKLPVINKEKLKGCEEDVLRRSGLVQKSGDTWYTEVLSFDERER